MKFFEELKKRNVYKVATAYAISSWLIIQVVNTIGPNLDWPDSVPSLITRILIVGFPLALLLAWLFELTPQGLRLIGDNKVIDDKIKGRRLNYFIIGVLSVTICFLLVERLFFNGKNEVNEKQEASMVNLPDFTSSIAVLAFDDMSPDKDQEYFSDGISEEILNWLTKYKDLKVISRTSSFAYKGKDVTIDIIGKELDVAYVLEGSVRKSGDTFRTTVQLIDTRDGSHIWSDTFDRQVEDALFVQDEIAQIVANRLQLTLLNEEVRLRKVDPEAYEYFLRVKDYFPLRRNDSTLVIADSLIRRSLDIDPGYAPAWNYLSAITFHRGFYFGQLNRQEAISIGMKAAKKAFDIDSTSIVAMNWISNWQWHNREGTESLKSLEKLLKSNPNNADAFNYAVHAYTRVGMPEKALSYAYLFAQVSPKNEMAFWWIEKLEDYMGNIDESNTAYIKWMELREQEKGLEPDLDDLILYYERTGDLNKALELQATEPDRYWRLVGEFWLRHENGQFEEADGVFDEFASIPSEEVRESVEDDMVWHYSILAEIYAVKGDLDNAFDELNRAFDYYVIYTEQLWYYPEFKNLHHDPRWQLFLERLGKEFNYDYTASE